MRVLIVHPCKGFYGGAEELIYQLGKYLKAQNHEVQVVTRNIHKDLRIKLWEKEVILYSSTSWRDMRFRTQELLEWADVINVHNFPATLMPFPTKKPIVYMCNEPAEYFTTWWRKPIEWANRNWVKKSGMKVIVADEVNANRFKNLYKVEPTIIPYGVDYAFWSGPSGIKREDRFTLLQVGHSEFFYIGKKILGEVRGAVPETQLVQLTRKTHEEVREWYGRAHVLIHPVKSQGGWLVPFEAMCAGLPVVVSKEFTASGIIEENKLGLVTDDFLRAVIMEYQYMGDTTETYRIREWVQENLTWEKFGEGMIKVFKEALGE